MRLDLIDDVHRRTELHFATSPSYLTSELSLQNAHLADTRDIMIDTYFLILRFFHSAKDIRYCSIFAQMNRRRGSLSRSGNMRRACSARSGRHGATPQTTADGGNSPSRPRRTPAKISGHCFSASPTQESRSSRRKRWKGKLTHAANDDFDRAPEARLI